ncbi:MAG: ATP-binding protein [Firmicutes bacterium]|nr:ATP-binding protein [Bacillota bacterium]
MQDNAFQLVQEVQQYLHDRSGRIDMADAAHWLVGEIARLFFVYGLVLWRWDAHTAQFEVLAVHGLPEHEFATLLEDLPIGAHLHQVRKERRAVIVDNLRGYPDEKVQRWAAKNHMHTSWSFPLLGADARLMGILMVLWPFQAASSVSEVERYRQVAEIVAWVMDWMALIHNEQEHQSVLDTVVNLTDEGLLYSQGERVQFANEPFLQMFGLSADQMQAGWTALMQTIVPYIAETEQDLFNRLTRQAIDSTEAIDQVFRLPGLPLRYIHWKSHALHAPNAGRVAIFRDITEQVMAEQQHYAFLSVAAHEFRTPLTVINGLAEWTTQENLIGDERVQKFLQEIWRESDRLMLLIQQIWGSVRIYDDHWQFAVQPMDLAERVRWQVDRFRRLHPSRLWQEHMPQTVWILANEEIVDMVLGTLFNNAARFSPEDSPVDVTIEPDGRLHICDKGPGVDEQIVPELFKQIPHWQARPAASGLGLGLFVAAQLLERTQAQISYAPRQGGGACFTVQFPETAAAPRLVLQQTTNDSA